MAVIEKARVVKPNSGTSTVIKETFHSNMGVMVQTIFCFLNQKPFTLQHDR